MSRSTPTHWCPVCGLVYWGAGAWCARCPGVRRVVDIPAAMAAAYIFGGQYAVDRKGA